MLSHKLCALFLDLACPAYINYSQKNSGQESRCINILNLRFTTNIKHQQHLHLATLYFSRLLTHLHREILTMIFSQANIKHIFSKMWMVQVRHQQILWTQLSQDTNNERSVHFTDQLISNV